MGIDSDTRVEQYEVFVCRLEENICYELSCLTFGDSETDLSSDEMPSLDRLAIDGR